MWQGVCSHLSRWYPFHVVCTRVHHLTCAFTHKQRIHGSMLDSDRKNPPPGVGILSDWGEEEEI